MADQTVYFASEAGGTALNPNNAVGSTTGTWAGGPLNGSTGWTHSWAYSDPTDTQLRNESNNFTFWFRKGTNSGNPTVDISIIRGGVTLATSGARTISSTTGQGIIVTYTPAAGESSQGLSVTITCTAAGGSPSVRNSAEIDYGSWFAKTQVGLAPVTKGLGLLWNVKGSINKSVGLLWNVLAGSALTPVTKSLGLLYNVQASLTKSVALRYNVQAGVTKSLGLQWNVLASGGGTPAAYVGSARSGQADSYSTTCTVPVPAGAAAGQIALLAIETFRDSGSAAVAITWPSGFTQIFSQDYAPSGTGVMLHVAKKTLTGADSGNYVATLPQRWCQGNVVLAEGSSVSTPDANSLKTGQVASISGLTVNTTNPPLLINFTSNSSSSAHTPPTNFIERQEGDYITTATREPGAGGQYTTSGASIAATDYWISVLFAIEGGSGGGLTPVTKSLGLLYNVQAAVSKSVALQFNLQAGVQKSLNTLYNVRAGVQKSLGLQYNVLTSANKSVALLYNVQTSVQKSLTVQYNVLQNLTPVTKPLALQWNVVGTVQKQNQLLYNVRAGVQDPLALRWNILTSVQKSLTPQWSIRAGVTDSIALQWNVLAALGNVTKPLVLLWGVGGTLSKPLGILYNVRAGALKSVALQWNIRTGLTDSLALQWHVRAPVTQSRSIRWNVTGGAQKSLTLRHNVRAGVMDSIELQWNVASSLTAPIPFKLGDANVVSMRIGSVPANRLYLGADQIWP